MVLLFFFFCFFRLVNFSIGNNESLERFDFFEWKSKIEILRPSRHEYGNLDGSGVWNLLE